MLIFVLGGRIRRASRSWKHRSLPGICFLRYPRFLHVSVPDRSVWHTVWLIASCSMVGPEFISMTAGEAENPRKLMHRAFSSFTWRLLLFFLGGALCVGIVIPYNDELLLKYIDGTEGGTGAA